MAWEGAEVKAGYDQFEGLKNDNSSLSRDTGVTDDELMQPIKRGQNGKDLVIDVGDREIEQKDILHAGQLREQFCNLRQEIQEERLFPLREKACHYLSIFLLNYF